MAYDRASHIARLAKTYATTHIDHLPIHPALGSHKRAFDEAYPLGRVSEELTRPLLAQRFPFPPYVLTAHCDTAVETRRRGKSVMLGPIYYPPPDYEISWHDGTGSHAFYVDVKSKEYHSVRRQTGQLEQFIDQKALEEYLYLAHVVGKGCWIFFHLWPKELMHVFGKANEPRYTAGQGHLIDDEQLAFYMQHYPVDDIYYVIEAKNLQDKGVVRAMKHHDNPSSYGYFIEVRHMTQYPGNSSTAWAHHKKGALS